MRWTMTGAATPAGLAQPRQGIQTLLVQKQNGRWLTNVFPGHQRRIGDVNVSFVLERVRSLSRSRTDASRTHEGRTLTSACRFAPSLAVCDLIREKSMQRIDKTMAAIALGLAGAFNAHVSAQSTGPYRIERRVIAGGGGSVSGGSFQLSGTFGQGATASLAGARFDFHGGFWPPAAAASIDLIFADGFEP
jgi:hypothetical protein